MCVLCVCACHKSMGAGWAWGASWCRLQGLGCLAPNSHTTAPTFRGCGVVRRGCCWGGLLLFLLGGGGVAPRRPGAIPVPLSAGFSAGAAAVLDPAAQCLFADIVGEVQPPLGFFKVRQAF